MAAINYGKQKFLALLLAVALALTGGTVFTYWLVSILGGSDEARTMITIGAAGSVVTEVELPDLTGDEGDLIPYGRTPQGAQITEVRLATTVLWLDETQIAAGIMGELTIELTRLTVNNAVVEPNDPLGLWNLFNFNFGNPHDVICNAPAGTDVDVRITMNEPTTPELFNAIVAANVAFEFTFKITPL